MAKTRMSAEVARQQEQYREKIGRRIRLRRERLDMTQEQLAEKLGYKSKTSINKIELGKQEITQSKIPEFAAALGITVGELMGWEGYDWIIEKPATDSDGNKDEIENYLVDLFRQLGVADKIAVINQLQSQVRDKQVQDVHTESE